MRRSLKRIDHHDAVYNLARAALLAGSLTTGKLENLDVATGDCLHQPYRFSLIENGEDIVREAKELGALGAFISGAGPSIVAIVYKGDRDYIEQAQALCEAKYPHWKAVAAALRRGRHHGKTSVMHTFYSLHMETLLLRQARDIRRKLNN
ncbi:MAG: hypothetical protein ACLR4Z_02940 [Butyricicoccaceae bacterium]